MLGLFAALTHGATAEAQAVQPVRPAPIQVAPPATLPVPTTGSTVPTTSSTATTTTTTTQVPPAPAASTTVTSETTNVQPTPIVDQPSAPSTVAQPAVGPREQLEVERTEHKLELKEELSGVDEKLEHINVQREERGRVTGPISMLATGYTTGIAALAVSIGAFVAAQQIQDGHTSNSRLDLNNDNDINGQDENSFRNISRTMGALSAVGFGVGIAGSVFLSKRLKERRELDPEARRLQNKRRELRRELNYSANPSGTGLSFGLSGRF